MSCASSSDTVVLYGVTCSSIAASAGLAASSTNPAVSAKTRLRNVVPPHGAEMNELVRPGYVNLIGIQVIRRGGRSTLRLGKPPMRVGRGGRSVGGMLGVLRLSLLTLAVLLASSALAEASAKQLS